MLNTVNISWTTQQYKIPDDKKRKQHKNWVSTTGYAAVGLGTAAGITGLKKVKFKHKMKVHKYSAYLAGISALLHLGIVKGLDKLFTKKD